MNLFITIIVCWFRLIVKVAVVMSAIGLCISIILGIIITPIAFIDALIYLLSLGGALYILKRSKKK